jgi:hypothetical protein
MQLSNQVAGAIQAFTQQPIYRDLITLSTPPHDVMAVLIYARQMMGHFGLWRRHRNGCACGRYAFYLECGQLDGMP